MNGISKQKNTSKCYLPNVAKVGILQIWSGVFFLLKFITLLPNKKTRFEDINVKLMFPVRNVTMFVYGMRINCTDVYRTMCGGSTK